MGKSKKISAIEAFDITQKFNSALFIKIFGVLKTTDEFEKAFRILDKQLAKSYEQDPINLHRNALTWTDKLLTSFYEKKSKNPDRCDLLIIKLDSKYINDKYIQEKLAYYKQMEQKEFTRFDINQEYDPQLFTKTFGNLKNIEEFGRHFKVFEEHLEASANNKNFAVYHKNGLIWTQALLSLLQNKLAVPSSYDTFLKNLNSPFINDRYIKQKLDELVAPALAKKEIEDTGVKKKIPLPVRREKKKKTSCSSCWINKSF